MDINEHKKLLNACKSNHLPLPLSVTDKIDKYKNQRFVELLKFIGEHADYKNKKHKKIGKAYREISREANIKLGIGRMKGVSVRQIKAISKYYKKGLFSKQNYIKIPYSVKFIFEAIISLVADIKKRKGIDLPLSSESYGEKYYQCFINSYEYNYDNIVNDIEVKDRSFADYKCRIALNDNFFAQKTPFRVVIGKEIEYVENVKRI